MGLERLHDYQTFNTEKELRETVDAYLADYRLNTTTRMVLEYITACAMRYNGACTIYRETIATKIGMAVTTVARALRSLRELGMIAIRANYRKSINGGRGASIFQILANETQHGTQDDTHRPIKNSGETPVIPNDKVSEKNDVSLFSNLSLSSSKQLSRFSDLIIHSVFIECSQKPGMNKALFQRVVTDVQAKEVHTPIVNPAAYLRVAVTNALHAAQKKKARLLASTPREKSAQITGNQKPFMRQEVLPDWFDTSANVAAQATPKMEPKSKEQLQREVEEMRRTLRGER